MRAIAAESPLIRSTDGAAQSVRAINDYMDPYNTPS